MRTLLLRFGDPVRRRWTVVAGTGFLIGAGLLAEGLTHDSGARWSVGAVLLMAATLVAAPGIAVRAIRDLRNRQVGIELLVTIAVVGAVLIGEVWEAAAVSFLFVLGGALESLTLSRTRSALKELLALAPTAAIVLREGKQHEVDAALVGPGDLVLVKPGGKIPVDGVVVDGFAAVDESSITGESMPREKAQDDEVFAGTVVRDGTVTVRTTGAGADTTLARIIHRVEEAQEAKAPAQRFMERFARWYTPGVVALAAISFAVTRDIELALTLLVIGCPGALVISIPVSVVAGIGRSARRGILVKGGEYLEAAGKITAVAFDKTGTLTSGRAALTDIVVVDPAIDEAELLRLAAAAEASSEHPLARPIIAAAAEREVPVPAQAAGFAQHAGKGVEARVDDIRVAVGTAGLMIALSIEMDSRAARVADRLAAAGRTPVFVARESQVVGVFGLADEIRPDAAAAVQSLREIGISRVVMLTGDTEPVAWSVAAAVGIDEVHSGLLPEDKLAAIRSLQAQGEVVAMVGDGVNDAPALATAQVGIAMGAAGTDVAIETADMALLSDRLGKLPEAVALSRRTLANLRQNVAIALATVAVLLTGVLAGEVHMAGGMLVHQVSVLVVILNAMRLLRAPLPTTDRESTYRGTGSAGAEAAGPAPEEVAWKSVDARR